jgi:putative phosphoesterase
MPRLIVTADIHGSLGAWMTIRELMEPGDSLAVAGDLFDTRYGDPRDPNHQPEAIRKDLASMGTGFWYVPGNCDETSFHPCSGPVKTFRHQGLNILLHHGHLKLERIPGNTSIVIQGHTHLCALEQKQGRILLNPGSPAFPRNALTTFAVIDENRVTLMDLRTGKPLAQEKLQKGLTLPPRL